MGNSSSKRKYKGYKIPPNANVPSKIPFSPEVEVENGLSVVLKWCVPEDHGGCPIIGYIIQHIELGYNENWLNSNPVVNNDCLLQNLVPGVTYQFRVVAENLIGYSEPSDSSEPFFYCPTGSDDDQLPIFIKKLQNTCAIENEKVELTVELRGQPFPTIEFFKDSLPIHPGDNGRISFLSSGHKKSIVFREAKLSDTGEIKAFCSNILGSDETSCKLTVQSPPKIKRNKKYEEGLLFQAGQVIRLKYSFTASPRPLVSWYQNGALIRPENYEVGDNYSTLKIADARRNSRGEYLFKIQNPLGEDTSSVLITVVDCPDRPSKPEVVQLSDNSLILSWKPGDNGDGGILNYRVEYFRVGWGVWLKGVVSRDLTTKICDLIPGSKYIFRVKAENLYGISDPSDESVEIFISDPRGTGLMSVLKEVPQQEEEEMLSNAIIEENEEDEEEEENYEEKSKTSPPVRPVTPPKKILLPQTHPIKRNNYNEIIKPKENTSSNTIIEDIDENVLLAPLATQEDEDNLPYGRRGAGLTAWRKYTYPTGNESTKSLFDSDAEEDNKMKVKESSASSAANKVKFNEFKTHGGGGGAEYKSFASKSLNDPFKRQPYSRTPEPKVEVLEVDDNEELLTPPPIKSRTLPRKNIDIDDYLFSSNTGNNSYNNNTGSIPNIYDHYFTPSQKKSSSTSELFQKRSGQSQSYFIEEDNDDDMDSQLVLTTSQLTLPFRHVGKCKISTSETSIDSFKDDDELLKSLEKISSGTESNEEELGILSSMKNTRHAKNDNFQRDNNKVGNTDSTFLSKLGHRTHQSSSTSANSSYSLRGVSSVLVNDEQMVENLKDNHSRTDLRKHKLLQSDNSQRLPNPPSPPSPAEKKKEKPVKIERKNNKNNNVEEKKTESSSASAAGDDSSSLMLTLKCTSLLILLCPLLMINFYFSFLLISVIAVYLLKM